MRDGRRQWFPPPHGLKTLTFLSFPSPLADLEGGKHFFNTVREGDSVLFATEDEQDAHNWVMAFYRATGQVGSKLYPAKLQAPTELFLRLTSLHRRSPLARTLHSRTSPAEGATRTKPGSTEWRSSLPLTPSRSTIIRFSPICKRVRSNGDSRIRLRP